MDAQKFTPEYFNQFGQETLPSHLGIVITAVREGELVAQFEVAAKHLAPNGFLHAGSVVTLADTACGYACFAHLPEGAQNFTTIELKSNHLGTARDGVVVATAAMPVAVATHASAPSRAARRSWNICTVGLVKRE